MLIPSIYNFHPGVNVDHEACQRAQWGLNIKLLMLSATSQTTELLLWKLYDKNRKDKKNSTNYPTQCFSSSFT